MHEVHSIKHLLVGREEMGVHLVVFRLEDALLLNPSRRSGVQAQISK